MVFFVTLNISFSSVSTVYFEQEKLAGLTNWLIYMYTFFLIRTTL